MINVCVHCQGDLDDSSTPVQMAHAIGACMKPLVLLVALDLALQDVCVGNARIGSPEMRERMSKLPETVAWLKASLIEHALTHPELLASHLSTRMELPSAGLGIVPRKDKPGG